MAFKLVTFALTLAFASSALGDHYSAPVASAYSSPVVSAVEHGAAFSAPVVSDAVIPSYTDAVYPYAYGARSVAAPAAVAYGSPFVAAPAVSAPVISAFHDSPAFASAPYVV